MGFLQSIPLAFRSAHTSSLNSLLPLWFNFYPSRLCDGGRTSLHPVEHFSAAATESSYDPKVATQTGIEPSEEQALKARSSARHCQVWLLYFIGTKLYG